MSEEKKPQFYRIVDLPGLKGLLVQTTDDLLEGDPVGVDVLINPDAIVGDRNVRFPLPKGALWVSPDFLTPAPDLQHEFSAKNPFGKLSYEGHLVRDGMKVDYARYADAITITVRDSEKDRTIYTQNFFGDFAALALEAVERVISGHDDADELVFQLQDLKDAELHPEES